MWDILTYLLLIVLAAGAVIGLAVVVRSYLNGSSPLEGLLGPRPDRRLEVVEHYSVDGRRRLVLVRRDEVEHLIMTGGPVDVVIETGISPRRGRIDATLETPAPVFSRQSRAFGQAGAADK